MMRVRVPLALVQLLAAACGQPIASEIGDKNAPVWSQEVLANWDPTWGPEWDPTHPNHPNAKKQLAQPIASAAAAAAPPPILMSMGAPVESDVKGNLGPASVVTDPKKDDWLTDRWQAAQDMNGTPIPGPHWVKLTLQPQYANSIPTKVLLDWETAYAKGYRVEVSPDGLDWTPIYISDGSTFGERTESKSKQHVIHTITLPQDNEAYRSVLPAIKYVKVAITEIGTAWGASLWGVEVWGVVRR